MTQNQINYQKVKEDIRHNLATEGYYDRSLLETIRHNIQQEGIGTRQAQASMAQAAASARQAQAAVHQANVAALRQAEDARHNAEMEAQGWIVSEASASERSAAAEYTRSQNKFYEDTWNARSTELASQAAHQFWSTRGVQQDVKYRPAQEAREWINTGANYMRAVSGAVSNVAGLMGLMP